MNRRHKSTVFIIEKLVAFWYCVPFEIISCLLLLKSFSRIIEEIDFCY